MENWGLVKRGYFPTVIRPVNYGHWSQIQALRLKPWAIFTTKKALANQIRSQNQACCLFCGPLQARNDFTFLNGWQGVGVGEK